MNQQIATASEEQSVVAEQINRSVLNVRDVSDQTSAASEQTAMSSGELEQLGQQLRGWSGGSISEGRDADIAVDGTGIAGVRGKAAPTPTVACRSGFSRCRLKHLAQEACARGSFGAAKNVAGAESSSNLP